MPPIARRADDPDRSRWDAFVASRPEGDLLQAWGWGNCTALAGEPPIRILVEDGGEIRGVAQVLMRRAPFGRQVAYVPHGPLWDRSAPDADRIFAWLLQGLRTLARKRQNGNTGDSRACGSRGHDRSGDQTRPAALL